MTQTVLSRSTDGSYYPRVDNRRPRISNYSPSSRSSTTRTPHRPQRPKKIVKSIWVKKGSTVGSQAVPPQTVKKSAMISPKQTWKPKGNYLDSVNRGNGSYTLKQFEYGNPEEDLKDYAIIDSGCSGSMTGDKDKLSDFKEFKGGYVAFGNDSKGGRISGKGTIKTSCLDFEKVSYVEELKFNLLSVLKSVIRSTIKLAESKEQGITCDDAEDLDDQQFIVHTTQPMPPEERTAAKEVKLSTEEQALHDELISLMNQESLAKTHNDDQRTAFEEEKKIIALEKGKEYVDSTFTLSTANTPPQSTGNTPTDFRR
ncbi:hypothetical protein Tco_1485834 [Tanacetum coccineum]